MSQLNQSSSSLISLDNFACDISHSSSSLFRNQILLSSFIVTLSSCPENHLIPQCPTFETEAGQGKRWSGSDCWVGEVGCCPPWRRRRRRRRGRRRGAPGGRRRTRWASRIRGGRAAALVRSKRRRRWKMEIEKQCRSFPPAPWSTQWMSKYVFLFFSSLVTLHLFRVNDSF